MIVYLSKAAGTAVLALGIAALGVIASTDAYSVGARSEVGSFKALSHMVGSPSSLICMNNDGNQAVQQ